MHEELSIRSCFLGMRGLVMVALLIVCQGSLAKEASFLNVVLDFLGVSATPSALRGVPDEVEEGDIWTADLKTGTRMRLTWEGGMRSPVFYPGGDGILALKEDDIVYIPAFGGEVIILWTLPEIAKIVGFHQEDKSKVLVLVEVDDTTAAGVLSLDTGDVTRLSHGGEGEDRRMLAHLKQDRRRYGETVLYVNTESDREGGRSGRWTDVFIQRGGDVQALNLSKCHGDKCGQPSLSLAADRVVYIRSNR